MYPVLIDFGPIEIKSYGVMLAVSFLVGYFLAQRRATAQGIDSGVLLDLCFYVLVSAIIGSRLFYVITHWNQYSADSLAAFYIWEGGLSMMGGILLSLGVSYLFVKKRNLNFSSLADITAPSIALGIALTRIGCFLYGCCYGLPTELPWGVHFPPHSAAGGHFHQAIHPTQVYSVAYGLVIFLILLVIERAKPPRGVLFGSFLAMYSAARFTVDFFRYYEPNQFVVKTPFPMTNNQLISAALFLYGAWLIAMRLKEKSKET